MWSIGVIAFTLLCNQKPFQARSRSKKIEAIRQGNYNFDAPRWQHVSKEAIEFVSSLLICDPQKRPTAEVAVQHPWLKLEQYPNRESELHESLRGVSEHILTYARTSELKRIACSVIAHKSSEEEIIDLRRAFDRFDYKKVRSSRPIVTKPAFSEINSAPRTASSLWKNFGGLFPISTTLPRRSMTCSVRWT